jgi:1-deoxy-D-xylulose-5-phosphate synthase
MVPVALEAAKLLEEQGISASVFKVNDLTGADQALLQCAPGGRLLVLEDCVEEGCLGQHIAALLQKNGQTVRLKLCNLGSRFVAHGKVEQLYTVLGIDAQGVADAAKELCHG